MIVGMLAAHHAFVKKLTSRLHTWQRGLFAVAAAVFVASCASPPAPTTAPVVALSPAPVAAAARVSQPAPAVAPAPSPPTVPAAVVPKEASLVELPSYAKRGKRLPSDAGAAGRAKLSYCRSFEVDKDAATYFKRLQKQNRLPTETELAERKRQNAQTLSAQQFVERDWVLRRDNNKSVPQKCKVHGGSSEGATAHVVFEADLNGRRQRGTAAVVATAGKWRSRDHGDWSPVR